jgi:hypothetical protein
MVGLSMLLIGTVIIEMNKPQGAGQDTSTILKKAKAILLRDREKERGPK